MNKKRKEIAEKTEDNQSSMRNEIVLTIVVLLISIVVGFFIGKYLFELVH